MSYKPHMINGREFRYASTGFEAEAMAYDWASRTGKPIYVWLNDDLRLSSTPLAWVVTNSLDEAVRRKDFSTIRPICTVVR